MNLLNLIDRKPPVPWAGGKIPWDDPDFSERMLQVHLSQEHDWASRRFEKIDVHVDWIHHKLLSGRPVRILDLGCGPGLYTSRLARLGHECVGIDFSPASIAYAVATAERDKLQCTYLHEAIRIAEYGAGFDLACKGGDITIAAESTRFSFPEAAVGIMGEMSPWNVPYMPFKIMLEFQLTAQPMNAQRAFEVGLINKVVPDTELMNEGIKMAEVIKVNAPLSLKAMKYAAYKVKNGAAGQSAMEYSMWVKPQFESDDIKEGAKAFAERRKPRFTGR